MASTGLRGFDIAAETLASAAARLRARKKTE
jgi:hypothetical protein